MLTFSWTASTKHSAMMKVTALLLCLSLPFTLARLGVQLDEEEDSLDLNLTYTEEVNEVRFYLFAFMFFDNNPFSLSFISFLCIF